MSIYGEGLYRAADGDLVEDAERVARRSSTSGDWEPLRRRRRSRSTPVPTPETQAAAARLGLRAVEVRSGAAVPDGRRGPTACRRWRCASSTSTAPRQALSNPVHRRAGDLRVAPAQRPAAADLRRRPAAPRLRQRPRRRAGLPPGAGAPSAAGQALQHRQRRGRSPCARSRELLADGARAAPHRAGDHRQVPRRRHPALLRRHHAGARSCSAIEPQVTLRGRPGRARRLAATSRRPRIASRRRARELDARGLAV